VTLEYTTVVIIIAPTTVQMRRDCAVKGNTQGYAADEEPSWHCHQILLLALSFGCSMSKGDVILNGQKLVAFVALNAEKLKQIP
jgi:hypothetical protein